MTSPDAATVAEPVAPGRARPSPSDLLLRPTRFFALGGGVGRDAGLLAAAYVAGLASAMDRLDLNMARAQASGRPLEGMYASAAGSWLAYWGFVLVAALFSGAFLWFLGGWWYRKRLEWAGDPRPDPERAREVYFTASLVSAVPAVLLVVLATGLYSSYAASWEGGSWLDVAVIVCPFWSIVVSYRGVCASFAVTRRKAQLWFLVLPLVHAVAMFALGGAIGVMGAMQDVG